MKRTPLQAIGFGVIVLGSISFSCTLWAQEPIRLGMDRQLWSYLRGGLNYLEASGKQYPPGFQHAGNVAYGSLGLTAQAVEDVRHYYGLPAALTTQEVLSQPQAYEYVAQCYADLLLRHYLRLDYRVLTPAEAFYILQKAWFLGPRLYKEGGRVIPSREKKANAYMQAAPYPLPALTPELLNLLP